MMKKSFTILNEPNHQQLFGAGSGNRTRVFSLEGCCSTIELYPHAPRTNSSAMNGGGGWIRTNVAYATDLQSAPFNHSGTPPITSAKLRDEASRQPNFDFSIQTGFEAVMTITIVSVNRINTILYKFSANNF